MSKEKPDVFLSFGGYLAIPLALAAKLLQIPIITHEQTRASGYANQFIAKLAYAVALSYPDSKPFFSKSKTVVTGNLIRSRLSNSRVKTPSWLQFSESAPILLVMGGSQGSAIINQLVAKSISTLIKDWLVVHQCGAKSSSHNYQQELEAIKARLPKKLQHKYLIREWLDEVELAWCYTHARAAVSRAGANTVAEIEMANLPSLLIPLPFSHHQEQLKNAQHLAKLGGSIVLKQNMASSQVFMKRIEQLKKNHRKMRRSFLSHTQNNQAPQKLYDLILKASPGK